MIEVALQLLRGQELEEAYRVAINSFSVRHSGLIIHHKLKSNTSAVQKLLNRLISELAGSKVSGGIW